MRSIKNLNIYTIVENMVGGKGWGSWGLSFFLEWVYDGWFKLPKLDYLLIWVIIITIAAVGFLEGVAVGIIAAVILFVLNYSRINVVRHTISGKNYQSCVMRPSLYQQLLKKKGDLIHILELQGYIFFGTANKLVEQIRDRLDGIEAPQLQFVLLDFCLVTGVDSSALLSFTKLQQLLNKQEIKLVFTNLPPKLKSQWKKDILAPDKHDDVLTFRSLDEGLAWCEDQIINNFIEVGLVARPKTVVQCIEESLSSPNDSPAAIDCLEPGVKPKESKSFTRLMKYLERIDIQKGDHLLKEGEEVGGLYFVEEGQVIAQTMDEASQPIIVRILEPGTVFGDIGVYAQQKATASIIANESGYLYYLSIDNLKCVEVEDPELAIVFHRFIAGGLGEKLSQSNETIKALWG